MAECGSDATIKSLSNLCIELRVRIIEMLEKAGSGHPGGSLSAIDLIATLYEHKLRHDPKHPQWRERDRFVLSKGHSVPALYVTLAHRGYFDSDLLGKLRKIGSPLQGHPSVDVPGIEAATGSLGQGLSLAQGMALAARLDKLDYRVYCLMGDGETQEGQVWEAAMSAAKFCLDNLVAIVDNNGLQIDGPVCSVMPIEPIADKWQAFGWLVRSIDGHDYRQILEAFEWADRRENKPKVIVAKTIKGKGVSFMENGVDWHGKTPNQEQAARAVSELRSRKV
jgi:transketolase